MTDLRGMPADLSRFYPPALTLSQLREGWPPRLAPAQLRDGLGVSDEPPVIGLDEDEPDFSLLLYLHEEDEESRVRRHLKFLIERTGERWLSFSEAVALLREREPMSIGQAQAIIDDMRLAYYADGGPWRRQSGKSAAVRFDYFSGIGFFPNEPRRDNTFVNEPDLIYWHDRNTSTPKSAPSPPPARTPASRASKTQISKIVAEYRRTDSNPTMDGACQFAQSKGVTGHQAAVRTEYREQSGRPGVGRRRKNP